MITQNRPDAAQTGGEAPRPMKGHFQVRQRFAPAMFNIYTFCFVLVVMGILAIFLVKPTVSEYEKRELAKRPDFTPESYFSGEYNRKLDLFYADTFPFRDAFMRLGSLLTDARGLRLDDVTIHEVPGQPSLPPPQETEVPAPPPSSGSEPAVSPESSSSETASQPSSTENSSAPESSAPSSSVPAPSQPEDTAVMEQNGSVFIYKGMGLSLFGANPAMGEWYANTINAYADALDGVKVYDMVIPTHIEFALPDRYKSLSQPQKPNIDHIYSTLSDKVTPVDAYSKLQEKVDDHYLYFNTDHHWTVEGAHCAYTAFAEAAGFEPIPYEDFEMTRKENFLGTLYGQTQDSKLREKGDYVDYPTITTPHTAYRYVKNQPFTPYETTIMADYAQGGNSYSVFLHGDHPLVEIQTGLKNGRKIMVVKESYGNAFSPFLANHYESVYIVDQRYFQLGAIQFIRDHGINELLFINNIFAANTPYHIKCISNLMYQQFVPPAPQPAPEEVVPEEQEEEHRTTRPVDDDDD